MSLALSPSGILSDCTEYMQARKSRYLEQDLHDDTNTTETT